jgi:hypothetical protein
VEIQAEEYETKGGKPAPQRTFTFAELEEKIDVVLRKEFVNHMNKGALDDLNSIIKEQPRLAYYDHVNLFRSRKKN